MAARQEPGNAASADLAYADGNTRGQPRLQADWSTDDFAEPKTTCATLAIGSTRTVPLFAPGAARPADNHTVIIEFLTDDVDGACRNLAGLVGNFVQAPTTMPWGNRSLLFRDPDGNLINFFTPRHPGRHREVRPLTTNATRTCCGLAARGSL